MEHVKAVVLPEPTIQADEVLIRPKAVGICRSGFDLSGVGGGVSITGLNFNENLKVWGNSDSPFVWPAAIRFLSRVKPARSRLRSQEFSLSDAKEAFATANDPAKAVKVQLVP